jgi:hypothetical protein
MALVRLIVAMVYFRFSDGFKEYRNGVLSWKEYGFTILHIPPRCLYAQKPQHVTQGETTWYLIYHKKKLSSSVAVPV